MISRMRVTEDDKNHSGKAARRKKAGRIVKRRRKARIAVICTVAGLLIVAAVTLLLMYSGLKVQCFVELGDPIPAADAFSTSGNMSVTYITDVSAIDASVTGSRLVHISANGKERIVILTIRDTTPPAAQPVETSISVAEQLTPDQLVAGLTDADSVRLNWNKAPVFGTAGDYPVVIEMKDMSGNTASLTSMVHIRAVKDALTLEAGSAPPALADFLVDAALSASFVTDVNPCRSIRRATTPWI
jgi:hypothetical protein